MGHPKNEEERFFDQHVADPDHLRIYRNIQGLDFEKPFVDYFDSLLGNEPQKLVLEYGCGNYGDLSFKLAKRAARIIAIDISGESVKSTHRLLKRWGLDRKVVPLKMDCQVLGFRENSFDLIVGRAVLHHLDLDRACTEIKRILKPDGRAIFIEPLGMNPLINLYRRFTPDQRTPDEQPFTGESISTMQRHFGRVTYRNFNFFPLIILALAGFFKDKKKLLPVLHKLQRLDESAFKIFPFLSRFCWTTVIECQPK